MSYPNNLNNRGNTGTSNYPVIRGISGDNGFLTKADESRTNLKAQLSQLQNQITDPDTRNSLETLYQQHMGPEYAVKVLERKLSHPLSVLNTEKLNLDYNERKQFIEETKRALEAANTELITQQKNCLDAIETQLSNIPDNLSNEEKAAYETSLKDMKQTLINVHKKDVETLKAFTETFKNDIEPAFLERDTAAAIARERAQKTLGMKRKSEEITGASGYESQTANLEIAREDEDEEIEKFEIGKEYKIIEYGKVTGIASNIPGVTPLNNLFRAVFNLANFNITCKLTQDGASITGPFYALCTESGREPYILQVLLMRQANGVTEINVDKSDHPKEVARLAASLGLKVKSRDPALQEYITKKESEYKRRTERAGDRNDLDSAAHRLDDPSAKVHVKIAEQKLKSLDTYIKNITGNQKMSRATLDAYNDLYQYARTHTDREGNPDPLTDALGMRSELDPTTNPDYSVLIDDGSDDHVNVLTKINDHLKVLEEDVQRAYRAAGGRKPDVDSSLSARVSDSLRNFWDALTDSSDDFSELNSQNRHDPAKYAVYLEKKAKLDAFRAKADRLINSLEQDFHISVDPNVTPDVQLNSVYESLLNLSTENQVRRLERLRKHTTDSSLAQTDREKAKTLYNGLIAKLAEPQTNTEKTKLITLLAAIEQDNKPELRNALFNKIEENKAVWVDLINMMSQDSHYEAAENALLKYAGRDRGKDLGDWLTLLSTPNSIDGVSDSVKAAAKLRLLNYWLAPGNVNSLSPDAQRAIIEHLKTDDHLKAMLDSPDVSAKAKANALDRVFPNDSNQQIRYLLENNLQSRYAMLNELAKGADIKKVTQAVEQLLLYRGQNDADQADQAERARIMNGLTLEQRVQVIQTLAEIAVTPEAQTNIHTHLGVAYTDLRAVLDSLAHKYIPTRAANTLPGLAGAVAAQVEPALYQQAAIAVLKSDKLTLEQKIDICQHMLRNRTDGTTAGVMLREADNWRSDNKFPRAMTNILKTALDQGDEGKELARELFNRFVPANLRFGSVNDLPQGDDNTAVAEAMVRRANPPPAPGGGPVPH